MEDDISKKQPLRDHHGVFEVIFTDKPDRRKEPEDQHQSKKDDSGE